MNREIELALREVEAFTPASELYIVALGPLEPPQKQHSRVGTKWLKKGLLTEKKIRTKLNSTVAIFHGEA